MQSKGPANLNSSLLVRKGQALPSPSGRYSSVPASFPRAAANTNEQTAPREVSMPEGRTTSRSDDAAAKRPVGDGPRVAMTVRLDHETHRRLRLLSAHTNKSSQEIFTEALENYMQCESAKIPGQGCACLANPSSAK